MKKISLILIVLLSLVLLAGCGAKNNVSKVDVPELTAEDLALLEEAKKAQAAQETDVTKKAETPEGYVKASVTEEGGLKAILAELNRTSTLLNRDIHGRKFGDYEYRWELVVLQDNNGDVHAAVIENGELILISPVKSLEEARTKFQPYGGWKK